MIDRRCFAAALLAMHWPARGADALARDPFGSLQWDGLQREFFGTARVVFDPRVVVRAPAFAEDPLNVPVTVNVAALREVELVTVLVDRNPIRRVLDVHPRVPLDGLSFRFKLEQASPVRAAARMPDGSWHVGGTLVDSAGGGCSVAGTTRRDGSWSQTLGRVSARLYPPSSAAEARLRWMVMHPMDTGLVGGIPAFYLSRQTLHDAIGRELLRLDTFEPVSENPVFSVDFAVRPAGPLRLVGSDNNGNRIDARVEG